MAGAPSEPDGAPSKARAAEQPYHEVAAATAALAAEAAPASPAAQHAISVNFRDLSTVSPLIQRGRIFRSSQVWWRQQIR